MQTKVYNGCPCGTSGECCSQPEVVTPEHECEDNFCEECYCFQCVNCGEVCYCEL